MDLKSLKKIECPHCHKKFRASEDVEATKIKETVKQNTEKGFVDLNKQMVADNKVCAICGDMLNIVWTIKHGEGYCSTCGSPYYLYDQDNDGKLIQKLHCGIKESVRAGMRLAWKQHGSDLEKYNYDLNHYDCSTIAHVQMSQNKIKEARVDKQNMAIPSTMNPNKILKVLKSIEKRDLESSDEKIEILEGKGVLVYQNFNAASLTKEPIFYSFEYLSKFVSLLK